MRIGVNNREGEDSRYGVMALHNDQIVGVAGPVLVEDGDNWSDNLVIVMSSAGENQLVEIRLVREGYAEPIRDLQIWLNVTDE